MAWGITPQYPLGQLRPSSAWRTTTSPTPRAPSHMASSQQCDATPPSPTNALLRQDATSINSPEQYTSARPKSITFAMAMGTPKCPPTSSATVDKWTFKCPHTAARTSSPSGFGSWEMARSLPEQESMLTNQNTWSPFTSHQTTHSDPPPPYRTGLLNSCKPGEDSITPWLKWPVASITPPPLPKWSDTAVTTNTAPNLKLPIKPSQLRSNKKTTRYRGLNIIWKCTGSTNDSPHSRGKWTSTTNSPPTAMSCAAQTLVTTTMVDQEVPPERRVMLLPEQAAELLLWYMQWSCDLASEMHHRRLVQNKAHHTDPPPSSYHECSCTSE